LSNVDIEKRLLILLGLYFGTSVDGRNVVFNSIFYWIFSASCQTSHCFLGLPLMAIAFHLRFLRLSSP